MKYTLEEQNYITHTHIINSEIQLNLAMLVRKCYIHQKEISPWERAQPADEDKKNLGKPSSAKTDEFLHIV